MKVAIIANPWAGRGHGRSPVDAILAQSAGLGMEISVEHTRGPGDGVRLARELAPGADILVVVGGDGTIHEVVNGMMPQPIPIAVLPAGSGNDFANLLGCPRTPSELLDVIRAGRGARIDVLDLGERFCVNSAGLGFEGIVNRYSHGVKRLSGSMLYLAAVFKALSSLTCPHFHIETADGTVIDSNLLIVSIGNGNRTGGAFYLTPEAYPDDGLIDVCVVREMGRLRVLTLLPTAFWGRHIHRPQVRMLRVASLTIECEPGFPMHVDGELVDPAPQRLEVQVCNRVLPVLCRETEGTRFTHRLEKLL